MTPDTLPEQPGAEITAWSFLFSLGLPAARRQSNWRWRWRGVVWGHLEEGASSLVQTWQVLPRTGKRPRGPLCALPQRRAGVRWDRLGAVSQAAPRPGRAVPSPGPWGSSWALRGRCVCRLPGSRPVTCSEGLRQHDLPAGRVHRLRWWDSCLGMEPGRLLCGTLGLEGRSWC